MLVFVDLDIWILYNMNIFNFTEQKDNDKEYKYKVLVYPNITYMRDLEKDSYVVVLRNVIKELNKVMPREKRLIIKDSTPLIDENKMKIQEILGQYV